MARPNEIAAEFDEWCRGPENALNVIKERRNAIEERAPQIDAVLSELTNDVMQWAAKMTSEYDEHGTKANEICDAAEGEDKQLEAQMQGFQQLQSNNSMEMSEFSSELQSKAESISHLEQRRSACITEHESLEDEIGKHSEKSKLRRSQIGQLKRRNKADESKIRKDYSSYRKVFGMHIKTTDSTTLRFTFANISTKDPDSECFVDLEDTGQGYRAKDCIPMIPEYEEMAQKLQKEGEEGLGSFLRDVRIGFERKLAT